MVDEADFEKRCVESKRILEKYSDRVPVICDKSRNSDLPQIEKTKFLVPGVMLCGEFKYIIHKHINQCDGERSPDQTIYLFVENTTPKASTLMSHLYEEKKADDGFLYMSYSAENTLGALLEPFEEEGEEEQHEEEGGK